MGDMKRKPKQALMAKRPLPALATDQTWSTKKQRSACASGSTGKVKEGPLVTHASLARVPASVSSGCYNKMPFNGLYKQY